MDGSSSNEGGRMGRWGWGLVCYEMHYKRSPKWCWVTLCLPAHLCSLEPHCDHFKCFHNVSPSHSLYGLVSMNYCISTYMWSPPRDLYNGAKYLFWYIVKCILEKYQQTLKYLTILQLTKIKILQQHRVSYLLQNKKIKNFMFCLNW